MTAYFSDKQVKQEYKDHLYQTIVNPLREKYNLNSSYTKIIKEKLPKEEGDEQLKLY